MTIVTETTFAAICPVERLTVNRGVAALLDGRAVAVFALADGSVVAVDDTDPCSGASVLSRGIIGEIDGIATVASPMYKQRFDLRSGRCLDVEGVAVAVHRVRVVDGTIEVSLAAGQS
jgi:nitrite reductase (NADH) small subunit